jgi:pimeloyl-ACP methyl ester carboxylesterase
MSFVDDSGTKLWYEVNGPVSGVPLVLSGGFGLLENQYDFVRETLAGHFRVIDWNYRGAGRSDRAWPGGAFNQDTWVGDLDKILTHLDIRNAVLWGTSTGSPISIHYAARFPHRVRALITFPMFKTDTGVRKAYEGFANVGEIFGYEALAALTSWIGVAAENLFTPRWAELARWEAEMFRKNFSLESLGATMAIVAGNDLRGDLEKIRVPTMLLMGESGNLGYTGAGNRALADEFLQHVPHAIIKVIPRGGGTYCMIEEPAATAQAVIDFVRSLS